MPGVVQVAQNLYEELGWEALSDRRMSRRILQIHKICSNKTPLYLNDKLPPNCRALFDGNARSTFREIICKSNRYKNSFSLMQLLPGTFLSNISMTSHLLTSLKSILIVFFVLRREVFSVYTILWVSNISFN